MRLICRIPFGYTYATPSCPHVGYDINMGKHLQTEGRRTSRKTGKNFKRRTVYKLFTMAAHLYSVVFLCILSSHYALVYAGVMQLEHPQQAFCEADFGKFVAKLIKLKLVLNSVNIVNSNFLNERKDQNGKIQSIKYHVRAKIPGT